VDALWLLPFKNIESEKNDINTVCGFKGREFNSLPLSHFAIFCLDNGRAEKIEF
jgi:hypothetical protein